MSKNKGRCKRCAYSTVYTVKGKLWCDKHRNECQRVAWGCQSFLRKERRHAECPYGCGKLYTERFPGLLSTHNFVVGVEITYCQKCGYIDFCDWFGENCGADND